MRYQKDILIDTCNRLDGIAGKIKETADGGSIDALESVCAEILELSARLKINFLDRKERKSLVKDATSKANGKKGGRPPKALAELRKEVKALREEVEAIEKRHNEAADLQGKVWSFEEERKSKELFALEGKLEAAERDFEEKKRDRLSAKSDDGEIGDGH